MNARVPAFVVAVVGAPLLTVLELQVFIVLADPAPLGILGVGLVLAAGQAILFAVPRLGAAKAAVAGGIAALILFAIFLSVVSIGLHEHPPT